MVLLKGYKQGKKHFYDIDSQLNTKIIEHISLFKKIYLFHNKPGRHVYDKIFEEDLLNDYKLLFDTV